MFEPGQNRKIAALRTSNCVCFFIGGNMDDNFYMKEAIKEAEKAYQNGDVPVGAIIVEKDKIIARSYNKKECNKIATDHAEIIVIQQTCQKIGDWRLNDCTLYVTMEPCLMCAGAILQSRIKRVVYGVSNPKFGYMNSIENVLNNKRNNHTVEVISGIEYEKSQQLLQDFFKNKRH